MDAVFDSVLGKAHRKVNEQPHYGKRYSGPVLKPGFSVTTDGRMIYKPSINQLLGDLIKGIGEQYAIK